MAWGSVWMEVLVGVLGIRYLSYAVLLSTKVEFNSPACNDSEPWGSPEAISLILFLGKTLSLKDQDIGCSGGLVPELVGDTSFKKPAISDLSASSCDCAGKDCLIFSRCCSKSCLTTCQYR